MSANPDDISDSIKALALDALHRLPQFSRAYMIARKRVIRPVDYLRFAEFGAIYDDLHISANMNILDVSGPQWFTLFLAANNPQTKFTYINILHNQLAPYQEIADALGITNLYYSQGDVRGLQFIKNQFDRIISISVLEHIYPAQGGDFAALEEIERVLKPGGNLLLTLPYSERTATIFTNGPVFEREGRKKNFYARVYDQDSFHQLVEKSDMTLSHICFICERYGPLALDYYEWGPGRKFWPIPLLLKYRLAVEQLIGLSLDKFLAKRYLMVSGDITGRAITLSANLMKRDSLNA